MSEDFDAEPRRRFVKKTVIASIALSQPMLFSGLIRASGGGGESTKDATTDPGSTDETTQPPTDETTPDETSTHEGEYYYV
jgi:hypothetical protein